MEESVTNAHKKQEYAMSSWLNGDTNNNTIPHKARPGHACMQREKKDRNVVGRRTVSPTAICVGSTVVEDFESNVATFGEI